MSVYGARRIARSDLLGPAIVKGKPFKRSPCPVVALLTKEVAFGKVPVPVTVVAAAV